MAPARKSGKRFSPWPLIGILSVLVPALIFAYIGWRQESQEQSTVESGLTSARPNEVVTGFFQALSDGHPDIAEETLDPMVRGISVEDPGFRGLHKVSVTTLSVDPAGAETDTAAPEMARAVYGVTFTTVRPWEGGGGPGPQKREVEVEKKSGRWLIVRVAPVP